jgi:hypothetical protein
MEFSPQLSLELLRCTCKLEVNVVAVAEVSVSEATLERQATVVSEAAVVSERQAAEVSVATLANVVAHAKRDADICFEPRHKIDYNPLF